MKSHLRAIDRIIRREQTSDLTVERRTARFHAWAEKCERWADASGERLREGLLQRDMRRARRTLQRVSFWRTAAERFRAAAYGAGSPTWAG